mmetsp:Transcript_4541/g.9658  ORF Transcript_4541/g.9658 Transcript_4541/m.9658 type:complete len:392 (+) Transcript_4541:1449-2624(+)
MIPSAFSEIVALTNSARALGQNCRTAFTSSAPFSNIASTSSNTTTCTFRPSMDTPLPPPAPFLRAPTSFPTVPATTWAVADRRSCSCFPLPPPPPPLPPPLPPFPPPPLPPSSPTRIPTWSSGGTGWPLLYLSRVPRPYKSMFSRCWRARLRFCVSTSATGASPGEGPARVGHACKMGSVNAAVFPCPVGACTTTGLFGLPRISGSASSWSLNGLGCSGFISVRRQCTIDSFSPMPSHESLRMASSGAVPLTVNVSRRLTHCSRGTDSTSCWSSADSSGRTGSAGAAAGAPVGAAAAVAAVISAAVVVSAVAAAAATSKALFLDDGKAKHGRDGLQQPHLHQAWHRVRLLGQHVHRPHQRLHHRRRTAAALAAAAAGGSLDGGGGGASLEG